MTTTATAEEAIWEDRHGTFYVDVEETINGFGVFGSETGFCYATFVDEVAAIQHAEQMNLDYTKVTR